MALWVPPNVRHPGYISGNYYSTFEGTIATTNGIVAETLYLYPFQILRPVTIQSLHARTVAGGTTSFMKCGIWRNIAGLPTGAPITPANLGSQATTGATTDLSFALSPNITLAPDVYWFGSVHGAGAVPTMNGVAATPIFWSIGSTSVANALSSTRGLSIAQDSSLNLPTLAGGFSYSTTNGFTVGIFRVA